MNIDLCRKILGVNSNSSKEEVTKAFKQKAKLYHPDINHSKQATEQFQLLNDAYQTLIQQQENNDIITDLFKENPFDLNKEIVSPKCCECGCEKNFLLYFDFSGYNLKFPKDPKVQDGFLCDECFVGVQKRYLNSNLLYLNIFNIKKYLNILFEYLMILFTLNININKTFYFVIDRMNIYYRQKDYEASYIFGKTYLEGIKIAKYNSAYKRQLNHVRKYLGYIVSNRDEKINTSVTYINKFHDNKIHKIYLYLFILKNLLIFGSIFSFFEYIGINYLFLFIGILFVGFYRKRFIKLWRNYKNGR